MRDYFAPSIEITAAHTGYHFKILDAKSYTALKKISWLCMSRYL